MFVSAHKTCVQWYMLGIPKLIFVILPTDFKEIVSQAGDCMTLYPAFLKFDGKMSVSFFSSNSPEVSDCLLFIQNFVCPEFLSLSLAF